MSKGTKRVKTSRNAQSEASNQEEEKHPDVEITMKKKGKRTIEE